MHFNLLFSPLTSQKVSVLLNQKFSLSGGNHRNYASSGAQDRVGSSGLFGFSPALSPSSSKCRRPLSPEVSDHDSYNVPLPPHPAPSTSSSAPARKKEENFGPCQKKEEMQQQQPQHSSSESSDEELLDEVFREPSPPAIPRESPLAEDLALSSDKDEGPLVSLLNTPACVEYPAHPVLPTDMSPQPRITR